MLRQAYVLSVLLVLGARGDIFSNLRFFSDPVAEWDLTHQRTLESNTDGKDREPLSPDYKDPASAATEQKPVSTAASPHDTVIPGGVIDVDANGFPSLSSPFGPSFDFPGFGKPGFFGLGGFLGTDDSQKWWKGPNVCIEREESTDDEEEGDEEQEGEKKNVTEKKEPPNLFATSIRLSNCYETDNKYECVTKINNHGVVKTFTVRYKCCYGYKRPRPNEGCTQSVDLKPLLDTLDDVKVDEFKRLVKSSGLEGELSEGNYTLFVPSDDALHDYTEKMNEINNVEGLRRRRAVKNALTTKDLVLSHAVKGFIDLSELVNEDLVYSENSFNSSIRINIYPTHTRDKMLTANCARVKKGNILAQNGIVHITDRVVIPARESVKEIIDSHPKLTVLKRILEKTDIPGHLKPDGHYTVFAPTDDAFNKLDESQRQKLLNGGGCADNILKHHFVAHTVCSSAIIGNATTHNVEGNVLNLQRTEEDELIFEGKAKITDTDIIATNGVLHFIDTLIIPESGQYIGNILKAQNLTKFQELVEKAGLKEELNNLENATVFVPSDEAFENPNTKKLLEDIGDDKTKLQELVRYHTVEGQMQSCDMNNNLMLKTRDEGKELRVNLYSALPFFTNVINRATVNCARLTGFDEKACGSVIHEVNGVLVPPSKNILEVINSDERYSTLRQILKDTEAEKILQENNRSMTFLAPTDETFNTLDEADKKLLLENKEKANEVMKNHILAEVLCCSGIGPHTWGFNSFVQTMGNLPVEVGRVGSKVRINRAVVTSCDNLATNGVVHTINKVLLPRQPPVSTIGGLFYIDI